MAHLVSFTCKVESSGSFPRCHPGDRPCLSEKWVDALDVSRRGWCKDSALPAAQVCIQPTGQEPTSGKPTPSLPHPLPPSRVRRPARPWGQRGQGFDLQPSGESERFSRWLTAPSHFQRLPGLQTHRGSLRSTPCWAGHSWLCLGGEQAALELPPGFQVCLLLLCYSLVRKLKPSERCPCPSIAPSLHTTEWGEGGRRGAVDTLFAPAPSYRNLPLWFDPHCGLPWFLRNPLSPSAPGLSQHRVGRCPHHCPQPRAHI